MSGSGLTVEQRQLLRQEIDRARREKEGVQTTAQAVSAGERRCFSCGATKPLDEFCKSKRHTAGRSYQCRSCKRAYVKQREREIRAAGGEAYESLKRRRTEATRRRRARQKDAK